MPQFCIIQCSEYFLLKECIPKCFQDFMLVHYSDCIPCQDQQLLPDLSTIFWDFQQTFVAAEHKQDCRGLANKIQCLARKIRTVWLLATH